MLMKFGEAALQKGGAMTRTSIFLSLEFPANIIFNLNPFIGRGGGKKPWSWNIYKVGEEKNPIEMFESRVHNRKTPPRGKRTVPVSVIVGQEEW